MTDEVPEQKIPTNGEDIEPSKIRRVCQTRTLVIPLVL